MTAHLIPSHPIPSYRYDSAKLKRLATLLPELHAGGHRVLIFSQSTQMLDLLQEFLGDGPGPSRHIPSRPAPSHLASSHLTSSHEQLTAQAGSTCRTYASTARPPSPSAKS
jgi:hypothetical protein